MMSIRTRAASTLLISALALAGAGLGPGRASAAVTTNQPYFYLQDTGGCWNMGYTIGTAVSPNVCSFPEVSGVVPTYYSSVIYRQNHAWIWNATTRNWDHVLTSAWYDVDCAVQGCLAVRDFGTWWSLSNPTIEVPVGKWVIVETDLYFKVSNTTWERHVLWNEYNGQGAFVAGSFS